MGRELRGSTLGVIGLGQIGQHLADLALAFGMRVLATTPQPIDDRGGRIRQVAARRAARRVGLRRLPRPGQRRDREPDGRGRVRDHAPRQPSSSTPRAASSSTTPRCSPRSTPATSAAARSTSAAPPTRCRRRRWRATRCVIAAPHIGGLTLAGDRAPGARDRRPADAAAARARCRAAPSTRRTPIAGASARRDRARRRRSRMTISSSPWPGACDCHMHVYEDAYPLAPTATFKPPHAPAAAYRAVQRELGLERTVVIQPTGYGFDNRCTLAALAALGPEARAIVVVAADIADGRARRRMHDAGVRGVRFMMLPGGVLPWSALERTAARDRRARLAHRPAARRPRAAAARGDAAARLPCRLVIDHVGRFLGPVTPESDSVRALCACSTPARAGSRSRRRTKARAAGRRATTTSPGSPGWSPSAIPSAVCGRATGRIPTAIRRRANASMLAWALGCVDDAATRRRLLVDNPAELYGFAP